MLSPKETQTLLEIISDPSQSFDKCITSFHKAFPKPQAFRAGYTLCYLLDEDILNKSQRIISIYFLYEMYKKDKESNIVTTPFYSVLLGLLEEGNDAENYTRSKAERKMIIDCIQFVPKVAKKSVQEWIANKEKEESTSNEIIDVKTYSKIHFESMPKLEGFEKYSVNPILKLDSESDSRNVEKSKEKLVNLANGDTVTAELNAQPYTPNFLRPIPECDSSLENFIVDDAFWLFPGVLPEPCWDYTLGNNCSRVKTLMKKSCCGQLKKSNIDLIVSTMKNDPEAIIHYGIHSSQFCKLVLQNKDLALEFLNYMSPYPIIIEYYTNLAQTKVNLNSMELFSKLVETHELPKEYISFLYYKLI